MSDSKKYIVKTLGCKANLYDSQLLEADLVSRGWSSSLGDHNEETELCIVNSCTVTDEADKQSQKMAKKLAKLHPNAKIVMTGCSAEVNPERLAKIPGVDFVVGNQNKSELVDWVLKTQAPLSSGEVLGGARSYAELLSRHPMDREWTEPESAFLVPPHHVLGESHRTRSFLKIQEGCNAFCTYCIIPYGRGPGRSLKISALIEQIQTLVSQGAREIVLTGTNIGDYGADWEKGQARFALADLIEAILSRTELQRLRVSSLDPTEITEPILAIMERDSRFCPHFHVSLQSPHSKILKLMKRKYTATQVQDCLHRIARLNPPSQTQVFVGMDIITGFPGETDPDFEESFESLKALPWTRLHVFPYSEREGTPATKLPGRVAPQVRLVRAQRLRELSLERMKAAHQQRLSDSNALEDVLFESATRGPDGKSDWVSGYSAEYFRVWVKSDPGQELTNQIRRVRPKHLWVDGPSGDVTLVAEL